MRRSGAGAPELQSLGYASDRGGQAPALRIIVLIVLIVEIVIILLLIVEIL